MSQYNSFLILNIVACSLFQG